ncbi:MAG: acyl carrier protein [Acutalibacteraceae bacterium]
MKKVIEILLNYVEPDYEITAETKIKDDLGMSSFDLLCFGEELFDEFGVRLSADDFRKFNTVGKLADYVKGA